MKISWRYALVGLLILGLSVAASYFVVPPSTAQSSAELKATLNPGRWIWGFLPRWQVEDIAVCPMRPSEAWGVGIGPGSFDDLRLFHITGIGTDKPSIVLADDIVFLDEFIEIPPLFPAGMGPRGTPGLDVDNDCKFAYVTNFFLDTVAKIDLAPADQLPDRGSIDSSGVCTVGKPGDGVPTDPDNPTIEDCDRVVWLTSVAPTAVDAQLTDFDNRLLVVASSKSNLVTVLDANSGRKVAEVPSGGQGPTSIAVVGSAFAFVLNFASSNLSCIDFTDPRGIRVYNVTGGAQIHGYQVVTDTQGRVYVSNTSSDSVTVFEGSGCEVRAIAQIPVGDGPRHMALSTNERFLYVSNAIRASETDNAKIVSVIDTTSLKVVNTITVAGPDEPAPLGGLAISMNNRHLLVYWEGGIRGTPGFSPIYYYELK